VRFKMSLVIGTNVSSLAAQRSLNESSKLMETAMERLSSGKMINSGSDDAAGLAKSMKMDGQIASLGQAGKNITEGKALVSAIDASLEEVTDILVRAKELAVQASSDTVSSTDRARIKNEYSALTSQLDQISANTRYNGMEVLNGTFTGKQIQVGAKGGETITVAQSSVKSNALGGEAITGGARIVVATATGGTYSTTTGRASGSTTTSGDTLSITVGGVSTWSGVTNFGGTADMHAGDFAAQINLYLGLVVCAGGSSSVKPLVSIVAYGWSALVAFAGQAGFRAGGRMAEVRDMGLLVLVSAYTAGGSE
jgi:flagellin